MGKVLILLVKTSALFLSLQRLSETTKRISSECSRLKSVPSSQIEIFAIMDHAKVLDDGTRSSEAHALVRRFSLEVAPSFTYPHAIHAVADHSRQERETEAAKWRPRFQDPNAARYRTHKLRRSDNVD